MKCLLDEEREWKARLMTRPPDQPSPRPPVGMAIAARRTGRGDEHERQDRENDEECH
jgi:hypothetical protein